MEPLPLYIYSLSRRGNGKIMYHNFLSTDPNFEDVSDDLLLMIRSIVLPGGSIITDEFYNYVILWNRQEIDPHFYYELGNKLIIPESTLYTEYKPICPLISSNPQVIHSHPKLIDIKQRWEEAKRRASITDLSDYCLRTGTKFNTRCYTFGDYFCHLLGDTLEQENLGMSIIEKFPGRLLDINDLNSFNGVYYCHALVGNLDRNDETADSDAHFFVMFCHRADLEIINTYGRKSPIYLYRGTKEEWISLVDGTFDGINLALGLPLGYLQKVIDDPGKPIDFQIFYRKIF